MPDQTALDEVRAFHAKMMAAASGSDDPRLERALELVPRLVTDDATATTLPDCAGIALLMTRTKLGVDGRSLAPAWFIPCVGASDPGSCLHAPTSLQNHSITRAWLTAERAPNQTAIAVCRDVWFSAA